MIGNVLVMSRNAKRTDNGYRDMPQRVQGSGSVRFDQIVENVDVRRVERLEAGMNVTKRPYKFTQSEMDPSSESFTIAKAGITTPNFSSSRYLRGSCSRFRYNRSTVKGSRGTHHSAMCRDRPLGSA